MTLNEAIQHCEEVAEKQEIKAKSNLIEIDKIKADGILRLYDADEYESCMKCVEEHRQLAEWLTELKQLREHTQWIPVTERLPKELEPVNITWINHNPESYYADIKDKSFTATGVYFNGQWYWWSTLCTDILAEYSHNYDDIIDDEIEIIAWRELPQPYKEEQE